MGFTQRIATTTACFALLSLTPYLISGLAAEESHLPRELDWERCVKEAAENNPDLRGARENVINFQAQFKGSFSSLFPQISASANGTDTHTINRESSFSSTTTTHQYSAQLNVDQMIFDGFKTNGQIDQSSANYQVSLMGEAIEKSTVHFSLKTAFAQLLYAQEQLKLAEHIAAARKQEAQQVELKYEGGQEDKGSYLLTAANYRQALYEESQARRNIKVSQRQLAQVLGRITAIDIHVTGELKTKKPPAKEPDYLDMAAGTPIHLQSDMNVAAAKAGITIARSEFMPTVSVTGSAFKQGHTVLPRSEGWEAGLNVSLPIFDGGLNYFDVRSASARYRQSLANRQSSDDQIVFTLEQTYNALLNSIEVVEVNQQLLKANQVRAEIAEGLYANGLASFQDYDQIQNSLISIQKTELQTRRDAVIAEANWELAQGSGDIP
ncbi:MAG: TolC family protein [Methylacidiphilales bacterium]|nr:TolC family protein [Candidatus Methylacidiphilales bacterium]